MNPLGTISDLGTAPVIALHSSASSGRQWKRLINELEDRFDVITPDLAGYGTDGPAREFGHDDLSVVAGPIIRDIETFATPVHLVGHAFGGAVALKIALLRPDLVKSLSLYEPTLFHFLKQGDRTDRKLFDEIFQLSRKLEIATRAGRPELGMKWLVEFWNGSDAWDCASPTSRERLSDSAPLIVDDFCHGLAETWTLDDLAQIGVPTLVMTGMDSPAIAQRVATHLANVIAGATLAMLPDLGHMAPICAPEWINPRIRGHIATVERRAAPVCWPMRAAA